MICENCGISITSEKIWKIHKSYCEEIPVKKVDYESMEWQDLKKFASEKGINTYGMKKPDVIKELQQLEG